MEQHYMFSDTWIQCKMMLKHGYLQVWEIIGSEKKNEQLRVCCKEP